MQLSVFVCIISILSKWFQKVRLGRGANVRDDFRLIPIRDLHVDIGLDVIYLEMTILFVGVLAGKSYYY